MFGGESAEQLQSIEAQKREGERCECCNHCFFPKLFKHYIAHLQMVRMVGISAHPHTRRHTHTLKCSGQHCQLTGSQLWVLRPVCVKCARSPYQVLQLPPTAQNNASNTNTGVIPMFSHPKLHYHLKPLDSLYKQALQTWLTRANHTISFCRTGLSQAVFSFRASR